MAVPDPVGLEGGAGDAVAGAEWLGATVTARLGGVGATLTTGTLGLVTGTSAAAGVGDATTTGACDVAELG